MRIYEGAPRQDYEEVLRSLGAFLDQRGMREILVTETADGFLVQGLAPQAAAGAGGGWSDSAGHVEKESFNLLDEDVARFMEEGLARRHTGAQADPYSHFYEEALRVLGRYIDEQKPRDAFFFEQEHAFVLRLLMPGRTGVAHALVEFTREDIEELIRQAPQLRQPVIEEFPAAG